MLQITEYKPDLVLVTLEGRIDAFNTGQLRAKLDELLAKGFINFIIDLSKVDFLDSAGMSVLVTLLKRVRTQSGDVTLVRPVQEGAKRILALTRLDLVFGMCDTADEAIELLRNPA